MKLSGQHYLERLADCSARSFENGFSRIARWLGLGAVMDEDDLEDLLEATYLGCLCNISFNGLGGGNGAIKPEREHTRMALERAFMDAKARLFACASWKALEPGQRELVERIFLRVLVDEQNLAAD